MKKGAIHWKGEGGPTWLMPGSRAHELFTAGHLKELAAHMRDVEAKFRALQSQSLPTDAK